jgi:hypothetical protein
MSARVALLTRKEIHAMTKCQAFRLALAASALSFVSGALCTGALHFMLGGAR